MKVQIHMRIDGVTPMIMNKFHDAAALAASSGTRGSSAASDRGTPQEICELKLYRDADGKLCVPQPNLLRCFADGGYFHKIGKKQITTKESSQVFACFDILGVTVPLKHKQPWKIDTRPVVIPATKGRILAHRPMFDDWSLEFDTELDTSIIGPKLMRAIIDDAGKRIGLGDFRPAKKGPYGKFVVTVWREKGDGFVETAAKTKVEA
jgi:hypothetical protein